MARSKASVPRAYLLLGSVLVLKRCLPAHGFGPRHLSFAVSSRSIRTREFAQRTRLQQEISTICAGTSRASSARGQRSPSSTQPRMSSHSSRPSYSAPSPPRKSGIGRAIVQGWAAALLCVASLFAGPDVLRIGDEVASATGFGLLRPPPASALSEEQVGVVHVPLGTGGAGNFKLECWYRCGEQDCGRRALTSYRVQDAYFITGTILK